MHRTPIHSQSLGTSLYRVLLSISFLVGRDLAAAVGTILTYMSSSKEARPPVGCLFREGFCLVESLARPSM